MPTTVLDVEQHLLLLELEAPFDKRDVQLARILRFAPLRATQRANASFEAREKFSKNY